MIFKSLIHFCYYYNFNRLLNRKIVLNVKIKLLCCIYIVRHLDLELTLDGYVGNDFETIKSLLLLL